MIEYHRMKKTNAPPFGQVIFRRGCDSIKIHSILEGECIGKIAEQYGVSEDIIRKNNFISNEGAVGEQLLILTPTRTHTVCRGDSVERLCLRFGISRRELLATNPTLSERGLIQGETIVIKYAEPIYGMGASNGYFYKGCSIEQMRRVLPYLTYVTVAAAAESGGEISRLFDDRAVVDEAIAADKIPLLRVYRRNNEEKYTKDYRDTLCDSLINAARSGKYSGIVLSEDTGDGYADFLVELRRLMIGSDLILITEISEDSPRETGEYADGSIISYDKYAMEMPPSFPDGEGRIFADFACEGESSKTFISLPAMAAWGRGYCTVSDAISTARQYGCKISTDKDSLISHFSSSRRGEVSFCSLENIKAILELVSEYGYMGVSFDIMRTPIQHFLMYSHLFRTVTHTRVRAVEGCSEG